MTAFIWIMLAVVIFVGGQILAMRPNARDQALLTLRETARKTGLQPRLLVAPEWLKQDSRQMVACYTLIVPEAVMPYWRVQRIDDQWKTVSGEDRLPGIVMPAAADHLLAMEGQANAACFYWRETAGAEVLEDLKSLLQLLAKANQQ